MKQKNKIQETSIRDENINLSSHFNQETQLSWRHKQRIFISQKKS